MFQKAIVEALWTDMKLNVKYLLNRPTDAAEPLPTPDPTRARKDCLMDNEFDSFLGSDNGEQQNDTEVKSESDKHRMSRSRLTRSICW